MQVSYSRINTFKSCKYKYWLRYIVKLQVLSDYDPQSPLILGHAIHTGIEKTLEDAIKEYYNSYPVINDLHVDEVIKFENLIPRIKIILSNGKHEVKIENEDFKGFIDLIVPVGKNEFDLYDFKYSNNVKNYMESSQLHLYKYYFEKLNPTKRIRNLYFMFIPKVQIRRKYKNKTNSRDETNFEFRTRIVNELDKKEILIQRVEYDFEKVNQFLKDVEELKNETNFEKNPSALCKWCEYQEFCEKGDCTMLLPENKRRSIETINKKVIWLYGAPFSGKTFLANKFPDPLMLNTDGNIRFVDAPYIAIKDEVKVEGRITKRTLAWEIFKDVITELEKKQNDFKTIVVDLIEDTYEHCRLYMYNQLGITHESDDGFSAWDKVRTEYLSTLKRLINLDYENIILISHEDTSKDITKKSGDKITTIKPNINDKCANKIAGMVDIVARVIADGNTRTLSFKTNEVIFGGGRLTMKNNEIPLDYDALMEIYKDVNSKVTTARNVPESNQNAPSESETVKEIENTPITQKTSENAPEEMPDETPKRRRRKAE